MANNGNAKEKAKPLTKLTVLQEIAGTTKLSRKQVGDVFDALTTLVQKELSKKGPGSFTIPGLIKLTLVRKKATKERKGPNPFKPGETITIKAKPARNIVRARALKGLNDMVK